MAPSVSFTLSLHLHRPPVDQGLDTLRSEENSDFSSQGIITFEITPGAPRQQWTDFSSAAATWCGRYRVWRSADVPASTKAAESSFYAVCSVSHRLRLARLWRWLSVFMMVESDVKGGQNRQVRDWSMFWHWQSSCAVYSGLLLSPTLLSLVGRCNYSHLVRVCLSMASTGYCLTYCFPGGWCKNSTLWEVCVMWPMVDTKS